MIIDQPINHQLRMWPEWTSVSSFSSSCSVSPDSDIQSLAKPTPLLNTPLDHFPAFPPLGCLNPHPQSPHHRHSSWTGPQMVPTECCTMHPARRAHVKVAVPLSSEFHISPSCSPLTVEKADHPPFPLFFSFFLSQLPSGYPSHLKVKDSTICLVIYPLQLPRYPSIHRP